MDTEQLRNFLMVAKYKNFTKAAEHLYIGQPALSRQIVDLEQQFGTALFIRNNRSVSLTPAGEILQKEASRLIEKLDYIKKCMESANQGITGVLNLATIGNISNRLSRTANETFKTMSWVDISVVQMDQEEMRQLLIAKEIDIGLTFHFSTRFSAELDHVVVAKENFCLMVPNDHPLNEVDVITKDMLRDYKMIILKAEQQPGFLNQIFSASQVASGKNIKLAQNIHAMTLLADVGVGIGIIPEFVAKSRVNYNFKIRQIEDLDTTEDVVMVWNKGNANPAVKEFVRIYQEMLRCIKE